MNIFIHHTDIITMICYVTLPRGCIAFVALVIHIHHLGLLTIRVYDKTLYDQIHSTKLIFAQHLTVSAATPSVLLKYVFRQE